MRPGMALGTLQITDPWNGILEKIWEGQKVGISATPFQVVMSESNVQSRAARLAGSAPSSGSLGTPDGGDFSANSPRENEDIAIQSGGAWV